MKLRSVLAAAAAVAAVSMGFAPSAHAVLPIETYGKDPEFSNVQISADGKKIAMIQSNGEKRALVVINRETKKNQGYGLGDMKVRDIAWSSENHVLIYVSKTTNMPIFRSSLVEYCGVFSVNTASDEAPRQLLGTSRKLAVQSSLCDVRSHLWNETGDVLMAAAEDRGGAITGEEALFRVNGDTGRGEVVARGTPSTRYFVTSPKGHIIARVEHQQKSDRYRVLVPTDAEKMGDWKTVFAEETDIPNFSVYGTNADENALIIGTRRQSDRFALFEMSLNDGSIGKSLFEPDGVDVSDVVEDPYTGTIVGVTYDKVRTEQIFFQNDLQGVLLAMQKALPMYDNVRVIGWDKARQNYVIFGQGADSAGDYLIFDRAKGKLELLTRMYSDLKGEHIAAVAPFIYRARDELPLQGYLTLPLGLKSMDEAKKVPLVVMPHGGPSARDSLRYDYWAQALASRGYAVVQMNFRGSDGYGNAFEWAGHGEWGAKMQHDVTDAVTHLIDKGIADPSRVCIVGASYGGYSALAGAAFTPDLYKCAVSVNGVTDLRGFLNYVTNRYGAESSTVEYWKSTIGNPAEEADKINARSPPNSADKVKADVLLIHGEDDTIVPYSQSETMHRELKSAGKSVQLVKMDGEDHWLSGAQSRVAMLKTIEGFLAKHLN